MNWVLWTVLGPVICLPLMLLWVRFLHREEAEQKAMLEEAFRRERQMQRAKDEERSS